MSQRALVAQFGVDTNPWGELRQIAVLGFLPAALIVWQLAPAVADVLVAVILLLISVLAPQTGVLMLLVLVSADIYIEPTRESGFFFSQLVVVALFSGMALRWLRARIRIKLLWFDWGLLCFLLAAALSIVPAVSKSEACKGFIKLTTFVMAFFVMRTLQLSHDFLKRVLTVITAAVMITSGYGMYQFFTNHPIATLEQILNLHVNEGTLAGEVIRWYSTFRYALEFATFLVVAGSMLIARLLEERNPLRRYFWGGALALTVGGLLASYSRSAAAGFLLSFLLQLKASKTRLRLAAVIGVLCLLVGLIVAHTSESVLSDRALSVTQMESYFSRWERWNLGVELVTTHPLLGVGFGNLATNLPLDYESGKGLEIFNFENLFLTYAAQIGVPGATILMILLVAGLIMGLRIHKLAQHSTIRILGLGIAGGLAAMMVNGITDPVLIGGQNSVLVFILLGLVVRLYGKSRDGLEVGWS
jgi:putative inorganic carbon (HCO3(-)) transporter